MIDTDKYEGHTVNRKDKLGTYKGNDIFVWDWFAQQLPTWASNADYHLLADAPLLLEEVKRLRSIADDLYAYIVSDAGISLKIIEEQMDWRDEE